MRGGDQDVTPTIRRWFAEECCVEEAWIAPEEAAWSVGVHRFEGGPQPLVPGTRLFTFDR